MRETGLLWSLFLLLLIGCKSPAEEPSEKTLFKLLDASSTGISFSNDLRYTEQLNTYTFKNFYNGGGVGLGDFNNDGLLDVFFSGNMVSNRLYLNEGKLKFRDISESAGISSNTWTTGVSLVDINADGRLDIYICKSGPPGGERRYNELFVNNGNLTFTERAKEYGLAFEGLSTHAAFFDYDKDGDLDCYLLNNSIRSIGAYDLREDQRNIPDPLGGNKLLLNKSGKFEDVTQQSGIFSSAIGFGLGVTIGDINKDSWPDIYVSNDFFEKDYLYINNRNGSFTESLEAYMREISLGSMGADMADINNDGFPEVFVTEMLPEKDARLKTTTQFENWNKYYLNVQKGYYHQFSRNVLQLNNGNGSFSEISRLAGVHATDWSWGALIFDADNDGLKDIFVANGIYKDLLDQDYVNYMANPEITKNIFHKEKNVLKRLIDSIPSNKISNYIFQNQGDLRFINSAKDWGLASPGHSNGSAYGDLDNDGDLDLVLNNVNMPAFVYENQSEQLNLDNATLSFSLHGEKQNSLAIGSKITIRINGKILYQELSPMRGFMSSVDNRLHFGLGKITMVDTVIVEWPGGGVTQLTQIKPNQLMHLYERDAVNPVETNLKERKGTPVFRQVKPGGINFIHKENDFVDFDRDRLLFNMISNEGPCICEGDINKDELQDFYIGGAKGQPGSLYVQTKSGLFRKSVQSVFLEDQESEDTDCVFFDADKDGWQDLYVASGSNEFSSSSPALANRLYFNRAEKFVRSSQILPSAIRFESTSTVIANDYDKDGDEDLFVGVRMIPFLYGVPGNGYILNNDGSGNFTDVTSRVAPQLLNCGLITDAKWTDVNNDSQTDLIVVGEWMPVTVFINEHGSFVNKTEEYGLSATNGWYNTIETHDLDQDGFIDLVAGNHGLNSRFKASEKEPAMLYVNDFDQNGSVEQVLTQFEDGVALPLVLRQDLFSQIPLLKKKYLHFKDYQGKTITDIFTADQLKKAIVLKAYSLETSIWLNRGGITFKKGSLPVEAQFSPTYAMLIDDFDGNGKADILMGGNLYRAKPETGIYDASYGLLLTGDGNGNFKATNPEKSGVQIKGEIRALKKMIYQGKTIVLVGKNNGPMEFFGH